MTTARDASATDGIAGVLEARREELAEAALAAIRSRLPAYRNADPDLVEDVAGHIRAHHDFLCGVLRRGRPAEPRELDFVARHAALRARRGVALADFLAAFRCYHMVVWDAIAESAIETHAPAEEALAAAGSILGYVDLATSESSAAFLEAQQLLLADSDRIRRDLLEDFLAGRDPASAAGLAAAHEAALDAGAGCVVVA